MSQRIGRYRIVEKLGEGGMGVVYSASDEQLDRLVAIKMIHEASTDTRARERLWREARAAASVNHPNVCQVYEVGEADGALYIAMELLEGESLAARIGGGSIALGESAQIALGVLAALEALHRREIVHRDLKPSNVFLTAHGVKLLDFGLARPLRDETAANDLALTAPGTVVGTPRYMAPEQWAGQTPGPACDLFAAGALLFEMLTGRPAFSGTSVIEVCHAIVHEHPPALTGGPAAVAVDRVIHRALEKRPEDRYASADAMAQELRAALLQLDTRTSLPVRAMKRIIVLPFRALRPDAETDYLTFGLADAITASLSGLESLVVRSSLAGSRFATDVPDLKAIAAQAEVDVVLFGTLLRAGDQVRVSTQLVAAPAGTLVWTKTAQVPLRDIFQLQDELARQIVESLSVPLAVQPSRSGSPLQQDVPANARAYEFYLRANQLYYNASLLGVARDLYRECLDADPNYAPAWARLGRVCRVMAKYGHGDVEENFQCAEEAFRKALAINPDLAIAHNLYTYFEVEELGHAKPAMVRLLERARKHPADPDLFAGLVVSCRFCGLLDASLAAHRRARQLDPAIRTSVEYTYWMIGDYERVILHDQEDQHWAKLYALAMMGREAEAIEGFRKLESDPLTELERNILAATRSALEGNREECALAWRSFLSSRFHDPEGIYFAARDLARVGETHLALEALERVVGGGLWCPSVLIRDPWLDPLRTFPEFVRLLRRAEAGHRAAAAAFTRAGGEEILGVSSR